MTNPRERAVGGCEEAKRGLAAFYITSGVEAAIALEVSPEMVAGEHGSNPDLGELQAEFTTLVQNGFDPSACAILLTDSSFRRAHWENRPFEPPYFDLIVKRGLAIGRKHQELVQEGTNPITAACDLVSETRRYLQNLIKLFEGGLIPEETAEIKRQATTYEKWLGLR